MDKGALHAKKKSSRRDRDRQGHTEQGGPDREAERECICYYSIYLPSQLLRTSLPRNSLCSFCLLLPVFNVRLMSRSATSKNANKL